MGNAPDSERQEQSTDRLRQLVNAYDVSSPTLDAIAEVIIAKTMLADGEYALGAVMDLLGFIIEDAGTFGALEKGDKLPNDVLKRMADLIASDPPANVPEWDLLQLVLDDLRSVLST